MNKNIGRDACFGFFADLFVLFEDEYSTTIDISSGNDVNLSSLTREKAT